MSDLNKIIQELYNNHIKFEEKHLRGWLYEYACQTATKEKIDYHKSTGYLSWVMEYKANKILDTAKKLYNEGLLSCDINLALDYQSIPYIVRKEHGLNQPRKK